MNTNVVSVLQNTNTSTIKPVEISISPEIRAQLLQEAAEEIGRPDPNDLEDLLARHGASQTKIMAILDRQNRASTNGLSQRVPAPTYPKPAVLNTQENPAVDQLDRVIVQLTELRSQISQKGQNHSAK